MTKFGAGRGSDTEGAGARKSRPTSSAATPPCPRPTGIACEVEPCWCRAETVASPPRYVSQAEAERMVETARAMVTAYDGMLAATFWIEYGALKSEIEEFGKTWANVHP